MDSTLLLAFALFAAAWLGRLFERLRVRALVADSGLAGNRDIEIRRVAHCFLEASRRSPVEVVRILEAELLRLEPEVDLFLFAACEGDSLVFLRARGRDSEQLLGTRLSLFASSSPLIRAFHARHRISPSQRGAERLMPQDRTFLALPIVDRGEPLAVCYVASATLDIFDAEEILVSLADLVGPVYRIALECSESRRRANVDGLTGLMTPIAFRGALSERIAKAERLTDRFALLFLDTDNFKACNDRLGHAAGDYVLKHLARILLDSAPPLTFFGRNGGDEFCLLLPLAKAEGIRCAEGIRRRVEGHAFFLEQLDSVNLPSITVSIGVAAYPADGSQPAILLERADAAMYRSKRSGRNRVSYYDATGRLVALD